MKLIVNEDFINIVHQKLPQQLMEDNEIDVRQNDHPLNYYLLL